MRVSLARALISQPDLLLLDEPFAALDEITRRALAEDIHRLWAEFGHAMVFVTHSVEEAVYMSHRVIVLTARPGQVVGELAISGPLPRKATYRTSSEFRMDVEAVSALLSQAMGPA